MQKQCKLLGISITSFEVLWTPWVNGNAACAGNEFHVNPPNACWDISDRTFKVLQDESWQYSAPPAPEMRRRRFCINIKRVSLALINCCKLSDRFHLESKGSAGAKEPLTHGSSVNHLSFFFSSLFLYVKAFNSQTVSLWVTSRPRRQHERPNESERQRGRKVESGN